MMWSVMEQRPRIAQNFGESRDLVEIGVSTSQMALTVIGEKL
jgi:hypothetical protein